MKQIRKGVVSLVIVALLIITIIIVNSLVKDRPSSSDNHKGTQKEVYSKEDIIWELDQPSNEHDDNSSSDSTRVIENNDQKDNHSNGGDPVREADITRDFAQPLNRPDDYNLSDPTGTDAVTDQSDNYYGEIEVIDNSNELPIDWK